jgi:hypothetical protein
MNRVKRLLALPFAFAVSGCVLAADSSERDRTLDARVDIDSSSDAPEAR